MTPRFEVENINERNNGSYLDLLHLVSCFFFDENGLLAVYGG